MQIKTKEYVTYDQMEALCRAGRQIRSDSISDILRQLSAGRFLARLLRGLPGQKADALKAARRDPTAA